MNDFTSCVICEDSITDPVCVNCYINQTITLLNHLNVNSITRNIIIHKLKATSKLDTLNETECILCKKGTVTVCRYCFSWRVTRVLRELRFPENLIVNFQYN